MSVSNNELSNELERLNGLAKSNEIQRMGKLFSTDLNNYYYDTGTGKVVMLDDCSYQKMRSLIEGRTLNDDQDSLDLVKDIISENLIRAEKPKSLKTFNHTENLEHSVNNDQEQLILELTGKCNLRCGYCVYNDEYIHARAFNSEDLTFEIGQIAIDRFFEQSEQKIAITFYGGEPLIKFELLKDLIEYSVETNKKYNKEMSFSLTTNATLVTEEMADYLASVPKLNVLCSIDGPEDVHDFYRVDTNNKGSFEKTLAGIKILSDSFTKANKKIAINAVFGPPYTYERLDKIEDFFNSLSFLPKDISIGFSYPSEGSVTGDNFLDLLEENGKYKNAKFEDVNPLWEWRNRRINRSESLKQDKPSIVFSDIDREFTYIDNRIVTSEPNTIFPMNGCCVPAKRRLYVDTKGKYYPCERMGTCPDIGDVYEGIDLDKIKKTYVDDYVDKSIEKCSECWAVKLCTMCYANRFSSGSFEMNDASCNGTRSTLERTLSKYHSLREEPSERIEHFSEATLT